MISEVYFDNSATTKPYDSVIELFSSISSQNFGNPSSLHKKGLDAEKLIKESRSIIANKLNSNDAEIFFTAGGTESNNLAIMGYLNANPRSGKHIITSKIEHPSVMEVYKYLTSIGYETDFIDVDIDGQINTEQLLDALREDTALISLTLVNSEIGTVLSNDILTKIKREQPNVAIHIDAVQAFGKLNITPKTSGIDLLSISSHKIHGPKGVGGIYVSNSIKFKSIIYGGGQENNYRSGTQNVPGICAFGLASKLIYEDIYKYSEISSLNNYFRKNLQERFPQSRINSCDTASPYILNVSFDRIKAEVLLHSLEQKNIYISTGSACSSKKKNRSHVLTAIGLDPARIDGSVRFSFNHYNTKEQIDYCIEILGDVLPKITIKKR